jgi:hypothetical protein
MNIFEMPPTCTYPFIFSGSAAQRELWPPRLRGFMITHNDAPQSVVLLCTSDQLVAETSTYQHTTENIPARWDSNPRSQQASSRRPTLWTVRPLRPVIVPTLPYLPKVLRFPDTLISFSTLNGKSKLMLFVLPPNIRTAFCCSWFEFKVSSGHYGTELDYICI